MLCNFRFPSNAAKGKTVNRQEDCHLDLLSHSNISSFESSKDSVFENNASIKSACSFPLRSETKTYSVSQLHACLQTSGGAFSKCASALPTSVCTETGSTEQVSGKWTGSAIRDTVSNKIARKQTKSLVLRNRPENEVVVGTRETGSENMSQGSTKVCASKTETSKISGSVGIDFPERKKIVKGRQSLDMFHTEDAVSSRSSSPSITVTERSLLDERLMKSEPPRTNSESSDGTQVSEANLCERTENLKNSNLVSDFSTVCSISAEEVQPTEDGYISNDEDDDEGIISFYNETIFHSPTVSQSKEPLMKPSVPADNSSKHAGNLKCALFMHTEQNSSDHVAETHSNVVNRTPTITEQSCRKKSYFRIATTGNENHRAYTPKYNPPSKDEILASLSEFCIPQHRHQEPFVSNFLDKESKKEVGNKVLKICSTSVLDLQPFVASSLNNVDIETWRKKCLQEFNYSSQKSLDLNNDLDIANVKPALASHREVIITPCKLPPSVTEVKLWFETTHKLTSQNLQEDKAENKVSRKIVMPLSPGQESASDDDMSLSPATPRSLNLEQSQRGSVATTHSTPHGTSASYGVPSPSCTPIHNSKHKMPNMLLKRSRKGLKLDSPIQENMSSTLPLIREEPEEATTDIGSECDARKNNASSGCSSRLAPPCDASGTYKQQCSNNSSEDPRAVESVQAAATVNMQSSSEVSENYKNYSVSY
jgi:hypothetical protein